MPDLLPQQLLANLAAWMHQHDSILVAYSGGVDSALLMAVAHRELGPRALACIGISPSYPEREMRAAIVLAKKLGANLRTVNTEEHLDPNYAANPQNRCYYCKSELFSRLSAIAQAEGYAIVLDGNNADDTGDYRPGHTAALERGVRSPLQELGITKAQVRAIAQLLNLPVWNKPAMACLSSRIPTHTPIVPALLGKIEKAENTLAALGFTQYRVRHHGDIARIELPPQEFPQALQCRDQITTAFKALGYRFITLDLAGFQSGSMNPANIPPNLQTTDTDHRNPMT